MMATKPIGIYVHVPFCVRKCNYCDFCSVPICSKPVDQYVDNLVAEIKSYAGNKISADTVFFGGGTPSILSPQNFQRITEALYESFDLSGLSEFTVECNPKTVDLEKFKTYKDLGVNRISIGMQSIHQNELKMLGRIHTFEDFLSTYNMALSAGFDNVSVDVMYGIPNQTKNSFSETLKALTALSPSHISCYGLIIEEGTPFYDMMDELNFPSEDDECDMYEMAHTYLSSLGYQHYEISNYAKDGRYSRHNLKYWHDEEYIGLGMSAHSYSRGKRYYATDSFDEYFDSFGKKYRKAENSSDGLDPFEYAMLALRLKEGMSLSEYKRLFSQDFLDGRIAKVKKYIDSGYMEISFDRIAFTYKGFYVSNAILTELL